MQPHRPAHVGVMEQRIADKRVHDHLVPHLPREHQSRVGRSDPVLFVFLLAGAWLEKKGSFQFKNRGAALV